ncbi:Histone transcription regulator 3, partial [Elasticomyces elasticus]
SASDKIALPNSTVMPILSVESLDQELSTQNLTEFFVDVFEATAGDNQYDLVTKLEPILAPPARLDELFPGLSSQQKQQIGELQDFLDNGNASLKLSLWKKLQDAYTMLSANANVVSCILRSIEVINCEILSTAQSDRTDDQRGLAMLRWLCDVDDHVTKALSKIMEDKSALRNVDDEHLISTTNAITSLLRLLQEFALCDDDLAVGRIAPPHFRTQTALKNFHKCKDKLRELYVKLFSLLYTLLKEATKQMSNLFERPEEDLTAYIRAVHVSFGERQYCKHANKLFVKLARTELLSMTSSEALSPELAQVMFDLYCLRLRSWMWH